MAGLFKSEARLIRYPNGRKALDPYLVAYTKINCRWIGDPKVEARL